MLLCAWLDFEVIISRRVPGVLRPSFVWITVIGAAFEIIPVNMGLAADATI